MTKQGYTFTDTAITVEDKNDLNSKPYLKVRATITLRSKPVERTIKAEGKARDKLLPVMAAGEPFTIHSFFQQMPANKNSKGGKFIMAYSLPKAKVA